MQHLAREIILVRAAIALRRATYLTIDLGFIIGGLYSKAAVLERAVGPELIANALQHGTTQLSRILGRFTGVAA